MKGSWFVPARGGLGESVDMQANTIASIMAKKTGGKYRLLHVPDHLGEEAYQSLIQDPQIQEVVERCSQLSHRCAWYRRCYGHGTQT